MFIPTKNILHKIDYNLYTDYKLRKINSSFHIDCEKIINFYGLLNLFYFKDFIINNFSEIQNEISYTLC